MLAGASLILLVAGFVTLRWTPECGGVQPVTSRGSDNAEGYLIRYSRVAVEGHGDASLDC